MRGLGPDVVSCVCSRAHQSLTVGFLLLRYSVVYSVVLYPFYISICVY